LFDKRSEFQKIQIVHSKTLGNMLILDELQNIAEADLIYTETLMQRGKVNYEGKEICILGGGDGALLYELLKENPKHVVMLEIDDLVMKACNKYMNSICGDVLEVRKRENYEIIVGDCMVWLDKYIKDGKKFDYVFGDLTDIPISDTPTGEIWDFIRTILDKSFQVLKPDGTFLTHGNGASCPESLAMYEDQLKKLQSPVEFLRDTAFVPSFMEDWIFYQVKFAKH
jgi:spermine synthase